MKIVDLCKNMYKSDGKKYLGVTIKYEDGSVKTMDMELVEALGFLIWLSVATSELDEAELEALEEVNREDEYRIICRIRGGNLTFARLPLL